MSEKSRRLNVFVQLAYGFGARGWRAKWERGEIVGINERYPYGYFHAEDFGCRVVYSEDLPSESRVRRLLRLAVRAILGFDLLHTWHNREALRQADVVWTHTESQSLSVLTLLQSTPKVRRPKLLLQNVWLIDRWQRYGILRRKLYRYLLSQADILTFHSEENLAIARRIFAGTRCELVLFGIRADDIAPPRRRAIANPLRIISIGNDEHRDWATLVESVKGLDEVELRIISHRARNAIAVGASNVTICRPRTNQEIDDLYDWADLVVLPLKPNLHSSGITVLEEAVLKGLPAICSDVGGLRSYFGEEEVHYVPSGNADALRRKITEVAIADTVRHAKIERAQARMGPHGLSSVAFARRHAELSRELVQIAP